MVRPSLAIAPAALAAAAIFGCSAESQAPPADLVSSNTADLSSNAATLTPQSSGTTNGLIAVSPVNARVVWASGRAGTFVVTTDGGAHWKPGVVAGAENLQKFA